METSDIAMVNVESMPKGATGRECYVAISETPRTQLAARTRTPMWIKAAAALVGTVVVATTATNWVNAHHSPKFSDLMGSPEMKVLVEGWNQKCPGNIGMKGYGPIALINAEWNVPGEKAGPVYPKNGNMIVPHMSGRTYFGDTCSKGAYNKSEYVAMKLLGKRMRYTTDVSGAGCGCNVALYLASMHQGVEGKADCNDYYCDSVRVCGAACTEIDIQEANMHSWFSTLHLSDDAMGMGGGYGGDVNQKLRRDFTHVEYGPNGKCIKTTQPFEVAVSFPIQEEKLAAMEVILSQKGMPCNVSTRIDKYNAVWGDHKGQDGMGGLTEALVAGMNPVISYWSTKDLAWMDGPGSDKNGPCPAGADDPEKCGKSVRLFDFSLEDL